MSIKREYKYTRTARYFLSDEPSSHHRYLCFVLHGHGQLPQYFLQKFTALGRNDILFVAPEGLHRYYLKGTNGRVGATWMTKEERLTDIDNYNHMLEQVAGEILGEHSFEKTAVIGFSQGVATACRWITHTRFTVHELVNWAGAFPPDLDFEKAMESFKDIPVKLLVGSNDEFITKAAYQEHLAFLRGKNISFSSEVFEGKHDIYPQVLKGVLSELFDQT